MNNKINRIKLAKMLLQFGELKTDKGTLLYEGDLAVGLEVFVEKEGELVPAEDGEYKVEDVTYIVKDGKIEEIVEPEPEEAPAETPVEEVKEEVLEETPEEAPAETPVEDDKIKALEDKVAELEEVIAQKDAEIADLKSQLDMSAAKPAHKEIKESFTINNKENKALKYFQ